MCEYCEKGKKIEEVENDNIYFTIFGRFLRVHGRVLSIPLGRTVPIEYCPMCRKEAGRVIVLGIILMILLIGMLAILEYYKGCEDTERAYKTKSCDKCANWKTINCPNSSECFSTVDKPYFKIKEESYE